MSVARSRPAYNADSSTGTTTPSRSDQYLGAMVSPITGKEWLSADEGSYFVAVSPTPGTGIIGHAAPTTYDQTKAYFYVYNGSTNLYYYPQILRLHDTVVSVGGSRVQFTLSVDVGNLYSSGGTAMTINNSNMGSSNASSATIYQGAVVLTAATGSVRLLGNYCLRGTIDVVEDDYALVFGAPDGTGPATSRVATVVDASRALPPVVIPPGYSMKLVQWAGSQSTGPTFEASFGFIAR